MWALYTALKHEKPTWRLEEVCFGCSQSRVDMKDNHVHNAALRNQENQECEMAVNDRNNKKESQ